MPATYTNKVLTGDQLVYYSGLVKTALAAKADASALASKQDALVFNTAYNATSNAAATITDINSKWNNLTCLDGISYSYGDHEIGLNLDVNDPEDTGFLSIGDDGNGAATIDIDWTNVNATNIVYSSYVNEETDETEYRTVADVLEDLDNNMYGWLTGGDVSTDMVIAETDPESGDVIFLDDVLTSLQDGLNNKQDALVFNTAYNASSNKVATMSDITTALGGISSFSFEIVQSLPQSNISTSKIYLVAKATSGTNQVYTEYAYVNNGWEIIGDTQMTIDTLSNAEVSTIWSTATATV